jgi:hypothetical protein
MNPKSDPALQGAESEHGRWVRQEDALHTLRERVRALEAEVERVQTLHLAEIECCHRSQNEAAQLRRELPALCKSRRGVK